MLVYIIRRFRVVGIQVYWDVTPCCWVAGPRLSEGLWRLQMKDLLLGLFEFEDEGISVLRNVRNR
jgi:hypothetical protein